MSSSQPAPIPGSLRAWGQWASALVVGLALCAAPAGLWRNALGQYLLKLDDYAYIASCRDPSNLRRNLLRPHNAHVVPLFRIETGLLLRGAGSLAAAPRWLGGAAYVTLVLAMLAAGHLVARESGRVEPGLAAMAAVGLSTVLGPSLVWYSASQATLSGVVILGSLIFLQNWRAHGAWPMLVLGFLASAAAPLGWSVGFAAGPVGAAYLWADGRRRCRVAAAIPVIASAITAGLVWWSAARESVDAGPRWSDWLLRGPHSIPLTAQAIAEFLLMGNLGFDSPSTLTPGQGIVLSSALALVWVVCRRRCGPGPRRLGPLSLEAAGATLVVVGFTTVFTARASHDFENLRALGWYHSIPQLGAVLFAFGWYTRSSVSPPTLRLGNPAARGLLGTAVFAVAVFGLQSPRAQRIILDYDGLAAPTLADDGSSPPRENPAAKRGARFDRQQRFLEGADRVERACREHGIGREAFRRTFGTIPIPDTPDVLSHLSVDDLLLFPEGGRMTDRARIKELLKPILEDFLGARP